jgi:hypothetical protein
MSVINGSLTSFRGGRRGFFGDDLQLRNTLAPGTFGSGTQVAQIVVDGSGDIASVANVAITGAAPTGPAGGALTGTYPNPQFAVQTQALNMGTNQIKAVAPGTAGTDAINLNQLQAISTNLRYFIYTGIAAGAVTWDLGAAFSPLTMSAAGTLNINNSAGTSALKFVNNFQILGNSPGNSWTFSAVSVPPGTVYATVSPQVNGANNTSAMNWFLNVPAGASISLGITITVSGAGTFTQAATSPAGTNSPSYWQIMQVF